MSLFVVEAEFSELWWCSVISWNKLLFAPLKIDIGWYNNILKIKKVNILCFYCTLIIILPCDKDDVDSLLNMLFDFSYKGDSFFADVNNKKYILYIIYI